jgi:hypothetical protein
VKEALLFCSVCAFVGATLMDTSILSIRWFCASCALALIGLLVAKIGKDAQ